MPTPHVVALSVLPPYSLAITFADGTQHTVNLENELYGEVFAPLRDVAFFAQATIEGHTVAWPNGADFSPEWLYEQASAKAS